MAQRHILRSSSWKPCDVFSSCWRPCVFLDRSCVKLSQCWARTQWSICCCRASATCAVTPDSSKCERYRHHHHQSQAGCRFLFFFLMLHAQAGSLCFSQQPPGPLFISNGSLHLFSLRVNSLRQHVSLNSVMHISLAHSALLSSWGILIPCN